MAKGGIIVAAAVVAAGSGSSGRLAVAGPRCTAVAQVSGAPTLVGPVVALLRERGVPVAGASECGAIRAVVASEDERVRVTIVDGDGRVSERLVDDVEGAATTVESWARGDLLDPLLASRQAPARPAVDRDAPHVIATEEADAGGPRRGLDIAALAEATLSDDNAVWAGARLQGCVELGAVCTGVMLRYAVDTKVEGPTELLQSYRTAIDLLLMTELPIRIDRGRFSLTPGLGAGLGALRAHRDEVCDECEDEAIALQLRGQVAGTARLSRSWEFRLDLSVGWAPYAQAEIGEIDQDLNDELPLAGAPTWLFGMGLGLVYGGL